MSGPESWSCAVCSEKCKHDHLIQALRAKLWRNSACRWILQDRGTRIPVKMFHDAVRVAGETVDVEEVECYLANMIYKGFIKGYISHEKRTVVVAAKDAFPRLADRKTPFIS